MLGALHKHHLIGAQPLRPIPVDAAVQFMTPTELSRGAHGSSQAMSLQLQQLGKHAPVSSVTHVPSAAQCPAYPPAEPGAITAVPATAWSIWP